jgi:type II secretory pathway component HofQ
VKSRFVLLVAAFLAAFSALASPRKPQPAARSRVRISRAAETHPVTVLGEDPSRRTRTGGYPAIALGEPVQRFRGEPISLDLKDADIRDVLLTFSKLAHLNMVIDPDVRGSVTVRLENIPWDQALEVILKVNGLGYVLEGSIVRVGSPAKL